MKNHLDLAKFGEEQAVVFMLNNGYRLAARNYRALRGEIDVIAWEDERLCFVEVKSRTDDSKGHPLESITYRKQRQIIKTALLYLKENRLMNVPMRFDAIAVWPEEIPVRIKLVKNAFWV